MEASRDIQIIVVKYYAVVNLVVRSYVPDWIFGICAM